MLYVFALSTVAVLSIGAQWLIQRQLSNGESDSRVINLAGRQRMLSQKLAKAALLIASSEEDSSSEPRTELRETLDLWVKNHLALQDGDEGLGLPGDNSPEVSHLFAQIEDDFNAMREATRVLLRGEGNDDAEATTAIQRHEAEFLQGMDRIVTQLVVEAERRVARLRTLEWAILGLTLAVLLAEGLFIFRPAAKRIQETVASLSTLSENLRRSRDEAEQANSAKSRFLANVSHELRTPMTAVLGMTELAQRTGSSEERDHYLKIVEEAGETLHGLLNDLIDLSQIDADAIKLAEAPFSPYESVRRVARMMEPACLAKGLRLTTDMTGGDLSLEGDARRLEQVLVNLVANAIKWTDEGGVRIACSTQPGDAAAELRLEVLDTGAGISNEDRQRVFEPFTQAQREGEPPRGGVGLGLTICHRLADAMGGEIAIQSVVGEGTCVSLVVSLPVASPAASNRATRETIGLGHDGASLSLLVVEDTEVNQLLIRKLLEEQGHEVSVVSTGEAATEAFAAQAFDAVLIDYQLPDADGGEIARRLSDLASQRLAPRPRLLCVTAHAELFIQGLNRDPFDAVLTKPIRRGELQRALADAHTGTAAAEYDPGGTHNELAEAFLGVYDDQISQLSEAIDGRHWPDAALLAHRFAGQVGYFAGGDALSDALKGLEQACRSADTAQVSVLAQRCLKGLDQLRANLQERRAG